MRKKLQKMLRAAQNSAETGRLKFEEIVLELRFMVTFVTSGVEKLSLWEKIKLWKT